MALSAIQGSFALNTGTGNQAVSGLGFQPKFVIFFGVGTQTAAGSAANASFFTGFGVSSSERFALAISSLHNVATSDTAKRHENSKVIVFGVAAAGFTVQIAADLVSLDSDGFTINITTTDGTARLVGYLAVGGTDITNVKAGAYNGPTATGNHSLTGLAFQPDCVLFMLADTGTASLPLSGTASTWNFCPVTAAGQEVLAGDIQNALATSNANNYGRTDKIASLTGAGGVRGECTLVSLNSDGWTLNWTAHPNARAVIYLAMKGAQIKVGSFSQPTSAQSQATTGVGFQPSAIVLLSPNRAAQTTVQAHCRISFGAGTSSSARGCIWCGDTDNSADTISSSDIDTTKIIKMMTEAGASPTVQASADLTSLDADGFTLNWGTADGTARQVLYWAIGAVAAAGQPTARRFSGFSHVRQSPIGVSGVRVA